MEAFSSAIREIRVTLRQLTLFDAAINALIVYLVLYLFSSLFEGDQKYAFYVGVVVFLVSLFLSYRQNAISKVGRKYPVLEDELKAAIDNAYKKNPVIDELKQDVTKDVGIVKTSSFVSEKKIYGKALAILVISFLILFLAPVSFGPFSLNRFAKGIADKLLYDEIKEGELTGPTELEVGGVAGAGHISDERDIYAEKAVAKLGEDTLSIKISPTGYELNVRNIGAVQRKEFAELYPEETFVAAAESFEENIPKQHQELVKNYFNMLAG